MKTDLRTAGCTVAGRDGQLQGFSVFVSTSDCLRQLMLSHLLTLMRSGHHHSGCLGRVEGQARNSLDSLQSREVQPGTGCRALGVGSPSEGFLHPPWHLLVTFSDSLQPLRLSANLTSSRKLFMIGPSLNLRTSQLGEELSQFHFSHSDWRCWGPDLTPSP